jgi:hypothetical protein
MKRKYLWAELFLATALVLLLLSCGISSSTQTSETVPRLKIIVCTDYDCNREVVVYNVSSMVR